MEFVLLTVLAFLGLTGFRLFRLAATLVPNSFVPAEFQRLGLAR